jgi:uncharacterized protein (DUF1919 family)
MRAMQVVLRRRAMVLAVREARTRLRCDSFSIISDDCWGGELYRLTGIAFATPFIGVIVPAPSYIRILQNLRVALSSDLVQLEASRYPHAEAERQAYGPGPYPVGLLTDVDAEVLFMHYGSWREAHSAWMRRRDRVCLTDPLVKIGTHRGCAADPGTEILTAFASLPFRRKLVVSHSPVAKVNTAISTYRPDAVVRLHSGTARFDHIDWLNGGSGQVTRAHRALRVVKYGGWR